jgi:hypothetical protein
MRFVALESHSSTVYFPRSRSISTILWISRRSAGLSACWASASPQCSGASNDVFRVSSIVQAWSAAYRGPRGGSAGVRRDHHTRGPVPQPVGPLQCAPVERDRGPAGHQCVSALHRDVVELLIGGLECRQQRMLPLANRYLQLGSPCLASALALAHARQQVLEFRQRLMQGCSNAVP